MAEAIKNVEKEVERVLDKFRGLHNHNEETMTAAIEELTTLKQELVLLSGAQMKQSQRELLGYHIDKIKNIINALSSDHRDIHGSVSKVGKAIDRNFVSDFASVANETLYDEPDKAKILNQAIVEHFLRQGMLEIAEELIREARLDVPSEVKNPFTELNYILDSLRSHDLEPALDWAKRNRDKLIEQSSSLEFKLHRLQFIELIVQGKTPTDLIQYARSNLQPLAIRHEREVQSLMGSLLYLKRGLENTSYSYFLDPVNWGEICDVFARDACCLLGLSVESPLAVSFDAGTVALPALLNIRKVMQQRQVNTIWTAKDELPIEISFPEREKKQFHSIFACPILRQQSSESNPPMRLVCGHVISRDALNKLSNGSKLKCPYCPMESNASDAKQIFF